jgi:hypothetical protein
MTNNATESKPEALRLLEKHPVSPEQRRVIMDAATKPPEYQAWFVDQFTRNR